MSGQPIFGRLELVQVIDRASPFLGWSGEIGYSFLINETWYYECHMEARGGGGTRLTLTFAQSQLSL